MLELTPLFAGLSRDPSDVELLSQLHTLVDGNFEAIRPYLTQDDAVCRQALTALFALPSTPLRRLIPLAEAQVRLRHRWDEKPPIDARLLGALADDPLCLLVLTESLNTDIACERVCTQARRACLQAVPREGGVQALLAALAMQAWINEYVWEESAEESAQVAFLKEGLESALETGDLEGATLLLLRWAMYRPLTELRVAEAVADIPLADVPPVLRLLWRRTLLAAREEAALRAAMPVLGRIKDATSALVRAQYEEHPYPRWIRLPGVGKSVLENNRAYDPSFAWPATFEQPLQILIAGCGTGKHPLRVAASNPDAQVLAVDLSLASLAYGQRMAREYHINNISFMQADLLNLPAGGRKFHHIECVGALPCVRDQQATWQCLTDVLYPGGTLYVGVYSKVARLLVTHLRARIAREGIPSTPAAMRSFRAQLLREAGHPGIPDQLRGDLFSLSMIRDFLFHVHERQHTLTELEQEATACGLRLLGYQLPPRVRRHVSLPSGPPTFAQWRTLESAYTGSMGMFLCTLYRPVAHASRSTTDAIAEVATGAGSAFTALSPA